ncbi:CocE/NonD family hydrolase [Bacillus marinisedimentorum]|uniref:CocE/NonD family hydrolase n=1 Tax=Bacillus marinisedimentorum TaxID=1821260 RepID=UPI000AF178E9|nr:CocE/NonD family hydrolase [Bacillus marinisedimentorum]
MKPAIFRLLIAGALMIVLFAIPSVGVFAQNGNETGSQQWTSYDRAPEYEVVHETDISITMRDGVILNADVYRPAASSGDKFPVIVTQTPYNKNAPLAAGNEYFVQRGYVHVVVDVRGTGGSQGAWDSFGEAEQRDGYEIVEWAANQPWSDGNVGLWGNSYMAINQILTASQQPPGLKAIFPIVPMGDTYRDIVMSGGLVNTGFIPMWLGLVSSTSILPPTYTAEDPVRATTTVIGHSASALNFQTNTLTSVMTGGEVAYDGPFHRQRSPLEVVDQVNVPTFIVGGLHDIFQRGEPLLYEKLKKNVPAKLLMGNWTHGNVGEGLPADGIPVLDQVALRWFDHYLKGMNTKPQQIPDVTQFVLGEERFETQVDWPHPDAGADKFYLRSGNKLSTNPPNHSESADIMLQEPVNGICSSSTNQWLAGLVDAVPCTKDNRLTELTEVTYTTEPLAEDLKISGPIGAEINISTTSRDAVLSVRVTDVAPDGTSRELTAGWLAASFRAVDESKSRYLDGENVQPWHPFTKDSVMPVEPGEPMKLNVEIFPTNAMVIAGHRLRVAIGPSDFPHSVAPAPMQLEQLGGTVSLLHDDGHASFVTLPVVK